jgi:hypothetical protein
MSAISNENLVLAICKNQVLFIAPDPSMSDSTQVTCTAFCTNRNIEVHSERSECHTTYKNQTSVHSATRYRPQRVSFLALE